MELPAGDSTSTYTYVGTGYANPHAVTSMGDRVSTNVTSDATMYLGTCVALDAPKRRLH
jgi:hypothetical protein